MGNFCVFRQNKEKKFTRHSLKRLSEQIIEKLLAFSGLITVLTTLGIIWVLLSESWGFFMEVPLGKFLFDTEWTPLFTNKRYGILPLLSGTFLTTIIAILTALPLGIIIAVYLSEYAHRDFRKSMKPALEILAAVPTVVYGFFALTVVTPFLQLFIPVLGTFNA